MVIGKWNKSVILTYIGLALALFGIYLSFVQTNPLYPLSCLIVAGVCDLFDGFIARKVKRTEEEKQFGIELDSLVDVIDFIALPVSIFMCMGFTEIYHIAIYTIFAICGIARLGYFNVVTADGSKAVKYYQGLPVTYSALIFPLAYLLKYALPSATFIIVYSIIILVVSMFNILNIKVIKPKGIAYLIFAILAIIMLVLFLVVL